MPAEVHHGATDSRVLIFQDTAAFGPKPAALRTVQAAQDPQRATIIEIDTDPIPADGPFRQMLSRLLVIEPSLTSNGDLVSIDGHRFLQTQMRQAVVVARGGPLRA